MAPETTARTDVGVRREHNEDAALATALSDEAALVAVADGMGGHAAGDVASELALETLTAEVKAAHDDGVPRDDWSALLDSAVRAANDAVHERAAEQSGRAGMGTTLVAGLVAGGAATVVNVGDSRAYHVTPDAIEQVTTDQSLVRELVEAGEITESEAETHPQRNVVTQALGTDPTVAPDAYEVSVTGTLVLCSDGLTEEVDDATIRRLVDDADDLSATADRLVARANENGGRDNVGVALCRPA